MSTQPEERAPAWRDLDATRQLARKLLLMSRGIHILLTGALMMLFSCLKLARLSAPVSREYVDILLNDFFLPVGLLLIVVFDSLLLHWRRERGTMAGDWYQPPQRTAPTTQHWSWRYRLLLFSVIFMLPPYLFVFAMRLVQGVWMPFESLMAVSIAVYSLQTAVLFLARWGTAEAWETFFLWAMLIIPIVLVSTLGLSSFAEIGLLITGVGTVIAGASLEVKWAQWVRQTRSRAGIDQINAVQP